MNSETSKFSKLEIVHLGVIAAMFIGAALVWNQAPDKIPVHWNLKGEIDRYGGKFEGLLLLPLITLGLYIMLKLIPAVDPGKDNYKQFKTTYDWIRFATTGVLVVVHGAVFTHIFGYKMDMGLIIAMSVGGLFVVLGNFMGKIRPNWFVGVRTPWTLSSKLSWTKTHRQAGWLFIAMGIGIIAVGVMKAQWAMIATIALTIASTVWLVFYSWYVWKDDPARVAPANTSPETTSAESVSD